MFYIRCTVTLIMRVQILQDITENVWISCPRICTFILTVILNASLRKGKKKKRIFFSLDGFLDRTNSRSSFELVNYSRFVFFFFFVRRLKNWKKMVLRMFLLSFCFVEGGRYTESGEANDEGEEIYKICIGRVWRPIVHDASGFPRQRRWIRT